MRLLGSPAAVSLNAMPLVGVGLVLLVTVALFHPATTRQVPLEVPRYIHSCYDSTTDYVPSLVVSVHGDMTARVSVDHDVANVPVIDLACAVYPHLAKRREYPVVYVAFDDDVPWGDVVATVDTLRGVRVGDQATMVALVTRDRH